MEFFEGFLNDYFAESDEHLTTARRALLALETMLAKPGSERATLEELFRVYHSLKGISGMVELRPAEQLAHELESYLRALRQRVTLPSSEGIDALIDGTQRLEQVIAARRASGPIPPIDDMVARIAALIPATGPSSAGTSGPVGPAPGDLGHWRVVFQPSRELLGRGVGVDVVRRRIAEVGDIVRATPHVGSGGTIEFEFIVAVAGDETALEPLRELGATFGRFDTPAAPEIDPAGFEPAVDFMPAGAMSPSHYVRVDLTRLDELMRGVGDLVISRARLADSLSRLERHVPAVAWRPVQENTIAIERQLRGLRDGIMRIRLVPVGDIFRRMPFVVRDLARSMGKLVELRLAGQGTEIDKYVIERMMDPVLHLVRNAISHGIETPEERKARGKTAEGTITLSAATAGDMVSIEIADDGRGIDAAAVAERGRAAGDERAARSTRRSGTPHTDLRARLSPRATRPIGQRARRRHGGREVDGPAAERARCRSIRSRAGTRFTIELPLTLAITEALIARVGRRPSPCRRAPSAR